MKKFHIIYKTTNLINGKFYIGKHSTDNVDDGYIGSGLMLSKAIKKYGIENFTREVLFVFDAEFEMESKERELVNENLVKNKNSYNIALGGQGGNLGSIVNAKIGKKMAKILKGKPKSEKHKQSLRETEFAKNYKPTTETKTKISITTKNTWDQMSAEERREKCGFVGQTNPFYGKKHKKESIDKMKETIGDSRKGYLNPRAKSITVNGITYSTYKECMTSLGLNKKQFYKFLGENNGNIS